MARQRIRLGELLVQGGIISAEQRDTALAEQKRSGKKLGQTLINMGMLEEEALLNFLANQLDIPFIDLTRFPLTRQVVTILPETHARRFRVIALEEKGESLLLGMADPLDLLAQDEVARVLKREILPAIVRESELLAAFDRMYRRSDELSFLAEELREELSAHEIDLGQLAAIDDIADAPIVRLLQSLFEDAVSVNASDIHIEPDDGLLRLRLRVDGVLQEQVMRETRISSALVLRLKLTAGLDISEKRLPQDGRFQIKVKGREIDVRMATLPIRQGEAVVLRLLDRSQTGLGLDQLGMPANMVLGLRSLLARPHGLILVTGPTGSGKTTTLYAALRELNLPERKIITVEDPVEYRQPRVNQVQVNPKIQLTFASVLRAALRQDPDVIMVGEMRDFETAEIGLRAAMTGHLVLSTLHTNDALASATRLIDMGVAGYLVASSLRAVMAQRLVRRVCLRCRKPYEASPQERAWVRSLLGEFGEDPGLVKGVGCVDCGNTGYRGRIGVYELLEFDEAMADALRRSDSGAYIEAARVRPGYQPLVNVALEYATAGLTTLGEVQRVANQVEEIILAAPAPPAGAED
ncbi:MAG TPA: GspE/PulE family protein [Myxococcota bacterium]|nr:GspE/PulE family protein [Myxococcota bacterium]